MAGCLGLGATRAFAAEPPFRFGLTPVFRSNDLALLDELNAYLGAALSHPVELVLRRTYQEIVALLAAGRLDAAWICGYPYVVNRAAIDLVAIPSWRGRTAYQSYIIVQRERDADGLASLAGDIHALSDPDSNSGFLVTQAALVALGTSVDRFFRRTFFTYGHRNVVRAVASGLAQSGSVDGYVWEVMSELEPELTRQTKVIVRSGWMTFPPVAAPRGQAGSQRLASFQRALLDMPGDARGRQVLRMLRLDGFEPGAGARFDDIAVLVDIVRRAS